jgi:hypothetical protein
MTPEEEERLREDIRWLFADRFGPPPLTKAEQATHAWEFVESRFISDQARVEPGMLKLRKVRCANCGQEWVHV